MPLLQQAVALWIEVFLGGRTAPFRPISSHYRKTPLIGHGVLTVNNSRMTIPQMLVTERQPPLTLTHLRRNDQYLNSLYVAVLHQKTTESQPYTVDNTFGYRRKNSYPHMQNCLHMLMVSKSEAEIFNN